MTNLEEFIVFLSSNRFVNKEPYKEKMYDLHNSYLGKSEVIKRWEDKASRCGSCVRRTQTNLLKHYQTHLFNPKSNLELWKVDGQDGRPLFRVKAEEAEVVETETKDGEVTESSNDTTSTPKQPSETKPKKRRGRKPKAKS